MNKQELRQCIDVKTGEELYFHMWVQCGATQLHPENPSGDACYAQTYALVENKEGEISHNDPSRIRFKLHTGDSFMNQTAELII